MGCQVCGAILPTKKTYLGDRKFCSRECFGRSQKGTRRTRDETQCGHCGKMFHIKPTQRARYSRTLGYHCSVKCLAEHKRSAYAGSKNPNYRGRTHDHDGYLLSYNVASVSGAKHKKLHIAVALEATGLDAIPKGYHVHHRDCDTQNCTPRNLAILSASDHKWLHKQFGNACLRAYMASQVNLETLMSWSTGPERARRLLLSCVEVEELSDTVRGTGGFGSTGVR